MHTGGKKKKKKVIFRPNKFFCLVKYHLLKYKPFNIVQACLYFFAALRFNQISISTAIPYSMRRSELPENSHIASSRLHLFRRLCHRDPHNTAFCRELQHLAARLASRNSTAGLWTETAAQWPQGLHKVPARKNSLEDLKVDTFAGSQGEAANYSMMAPVESPLLGASTTMDISQAEPLQAPGTERWHLISWTKQMCG